MIFQRNTDTYGVYGGITTGRLTPCLQKKIDKTTYLVEVHFSDTSTQSVEDKLKRVILHDLEHGKQGRPRKSDEK